MDFPIYIHGYVKPEYLTDFRNGDLEELAVYPKNLKGSEETVHISIPFSQVSMDNDGVFYLNRPNFEREL